MSATRLKTVKPTKAGQEIKMQDASLDIWDKKYRLKDKQSQPVDADINATYLRVAKALSDVESKEKRKEWQERFVWALQHGALASRSASFCSASRSSVAATTASGWSWAWHFAGRRACSTRCTAFLRALSY